MAVIHCSNSTVIHLLECLQRNIKYWTNNLALKMHETQKNSCRLFLAMFHKRNEVRKEIYSRGGKIAGCIIGWVENKYIINCLKK